MAFTFLDALKVIRRTHISSLTFFTLGFKFKTLFYVNDSCLPKALKFFFTISVDYAWNTKLVLNKSKFHYVLEKKPLQREKVSETT